MNYQRESRDAGANFSSKMEVMDAMHKSGYAGRNLLSCVILLAGALGSAAQDKVVEPQQDPVSSELAASGQDPEIIAVPNRPTFASIAETVQRGVFEIEYGFEGADNHQNINGLLKFGISKNLELRFANNPVQRDAGIVVRGDSAAGFKYRICPENKNRPTVAVLYAAAIPTATGGMGIGALGHSVQILVSKDFGRHHFDFNEGAQFVGRPRAAGFDRNYFTALSYSHAIKGKWAYSAELAGSSWTNAAVPATLTILAAPTFSVSPRLVLDAGAYLGIYGNFPRVTYVFGVTYAVGDAYQHWRKE